MIRRPPRSTRTDTLFPYTTLFRSTRSPSTNPAAMAERISGGRDGPFPASATALLLVDMQRIWLEPGRNPGHPDWGEDQPFHRPVAGPPMPNQREQPDEARGAGRAVIHPIIRSLTRNGPPREPATHPNATPHTPPHPPHHPRP